MLKILFIFLALLVPELALAEAIIKPPGGDTWDLYVFGNARVIADTLESVKLLMAPESGETGYRTVMLFMATLGFLVLAIRAGFNPSQGFVPMFTYILVAWVVSWGTTTLKINVHVLDTVDSSAPAYTVQKAPAIVALPAVLVSNVGNYFTSTIERYFTTPNELKITGDRVNGFNIFAKVMQEANQFNITNSNLKQTLRAYMADCTVPAIAAGVFTGTTKDAAGNDVTLYGVEALTKSDNLMATLGSANYKAVYTKYYPMDATSAAAAIQAGSATGDVTAQQAMSSGLLVACDIAYNYLSSDIRAHADALFAASSDAWSKTGTMVQLDATFSASLAQVGSVGGANRFASLASPQTFIAQQAVINNMSGAFRQAAAQTGNNEFLTAANMAQAEQNQKSAWSSGFSVFNNMMGYVYSVLQAFIFAIMPIVVIALFVPGLGKGIFTNYGQILVWLALWSPMLAIINYLVTIFGYEQIGTVYALNGGPNYQNTAVVSEKTNDMVLAAQFLGISTPLITWGLVKGALAFTEFIQSGIGSSFAQSAGASAASGNMSMGNISNNSVNMDKFNTAMSSTVGFQQTAAFSGAGALLNTSQAGGSRHEAHGGAVGSATSMTKEQSESLQMTKEVAQTFSASQSMGWSKQQTFDYAAQSMNSQQFRQFLDESAKAGINYSDEMRTAQGRTADQSRQTAEQINESIAAHAKVGGQVSINPLKMGADAGAGLQANLQNAKNFNDAQGFRESSDSSHGTAIGKSSGRDGSSGTGWSKSVDGSTSVRTGEGETKTWGEQLSAAVSFSQKSAETLQESIRASHQTSMDTGVTVRDANRISAEHGDAPGKLAGVDERLAQARQDLADAPGALAPAMAMNPTSQAGTQGFDASHARAQAGAKAGISAAAAGAAQVAANMPQGADPEAVERSQRMTNGRITADGELVDNKGENIRDFAGAPNPVMAGVRLVGGVAEAGDQALGAAQQKGSAPQGANYAAP